MENQPFKFTGKGAEYFSIWIVNVALTILTLGIYSAWAKVRTQQYFYGNTVLDGASFRYTAKPIQILKGRVIAFIALLLYSAASNMGPILAGSALIILMVLIPAFVVMSMAFRLRNSTYRNVKFNFNKNFQTAYKIFAIPVITIGFYIFILGYIEDGQAAFPVLIPLLLLSIVLLFPWWEYLLTQYKVNHAKYGSSPFSFSATNKNYYALYLKAYGILLLILFVLFVIFKLATMINLPVIQILGLFILLPVYLWISAYLQAKRTNLLYNNLNINGHKVRSNLTVNYLLYLYITNTLAIMLSFGLLMPWAKVRTAKYRASVTSIDVADDLNRFVAEQTEKQSALGEEMGEMFDLDLGF